MKNISLYFYQTITYEVSDSKDKVIKKIFTLIGERRYILEFPNLSGHLVEADSFILTSSRDKYPSTLKGVISSTAKNGTTIEIAIRPHWIYIIIFLVFLFYSIYSLITKKVNPDAIPLPVICLVAMVGIVMVARRAARRIRYSFETYFGLAKSRKK